MFLSLFFRAFKAVALDTERDPARVACGGCESTPVSSPYRDTVFRVHRVGFRARQLRWNLIFLLISGSRWIDDGD